MDTFNGDFVSGSGLITPRFDVSFLHSGVNTPIRFGSHVSTLTQDSINAAFDQCKDGKLQPTANGEQTQGSIHTPSSYDQQQQQRYGQDFWFECQFNGQMGPVAERSTFPPNIAPYPPEDSMGALTIENKLSSDFWDSMLISGYNSFSDGFVARANGAEKERAKVKPTWGSRSCSSCTYCKHLKMICASSSAEPGSPCKRCLTTGRECIFEQSKRSFFKSSL